MNIHILLFLVTIVVTCRAYFLPEKRRQEAIKPIGRRRAYNRRSDSLEVEAHFNSDSEVRGTDTYKDYSLPASEGFSSNEISEIVQSESVAQASVGSQHGEGNQFSGENTINEYTPEEFGYANQYGEVAQASASAEVHISGTNHGDSGAIAQASAEVQFGKGINHSAESQADAIVEANAETSQFNEESQADLQVQKNGNIQAEKEPQVATLPPKIFPGAGIESIIDFQKLKNENSATVPITPPSQHGKVAQNGGPAQHGGATQYGAQYGGTGMYGGAAPYISRPHFGGADQYGGAAQFGGLPQYGGVGHYGQLFGVYREVQHGGTTAGNFAGQKPTTPGFTAPPYGGTTQYVGAIPGNLAGNYIKDTQYSKPIAVNLPTSHGGGNNNGINQGNTAGHHVGNMHGGNYYPQKLPKSSSFVKGTSAGQYNGTLLPGAIPHTNPYSTLPPGYHYGYNHGYPVASRPPNYGGAVPNPGVIPLNNAPGPSNGVPQTNWDNLNNVNHALLQDNGRTPYHLIKYNDLNNIAPRLDSSNTNGEGFRGEPVVNAATQATATVQANQSGEKMLTTNGVRASAQTSAEVNGNAYDQYSLAQANAMVRAQEEPKYNAPLYNPAAQLLPELQTKSRAQHEGGTQRYEENFPVYDIKKHKNGGRPNSNDGDQYNVVKPNAMVRAKEEPEYNEQLYSPPVQPLPGLQAHSGPQQEAGTQRNVGQNFATPFGGVPQAIPFGGVEKYTGNPGEVVNIRASLEHLNKLKARYSAKPYVDKATQYLGTKNDGSANANHGYKYSEPEPNAMARVKDEPKYNGQLYSPTVQAFPGVQAEYRAQYEGGAPRNVGHFADNHLKIHKNSGGNNINQYSVVKPNAMVRAKEGPKYTGQLYNPALQALPGVQTEYRAQYEGGVPRHIGHFADNHIKIHRNGGGANANDVNQYSVVQPNAMVRAKEEPEYNEQLYSPPVQPLPGLQAQSGLQHEAGTQHNVGQDFATLFGGLPQTIPYGGAEKYNGNPGEVVNIRASLEHLNKLKARYADKATQYLGTKNNPKILETGDMTETRVGHRYPHHGQGPDHHYSPRWHHV